MHPGLTTEPIHDARSATPLRQRDGRTIANSALTSRNPATVRSGFVSRLRRAGEIHIIDSVYVINGSRNPLSPPQPFGPCIAVILDHQRRLYLSAGQFVVLA